MKVILFYFSATQNTAKIAHLIKNKLVELNSEVKEYNITGKDDREKHIDLQKYDAVLFGFPIYALRIPKPVREWLPDINGMDKKCGMFFTYGGVTRGIAHYETKKLLEKQNFKVVASADFPMSHTYNLGGWNLNPNRPNERDIKIARSFAEILYKRFSANKDFVFNIPKPDVDKREIKTSKNLNKHGVPPPIFQKENCTQCQICENVCPTGAIDIHKGAINMKLCLHCFRCIINCPEDALKAPDLSQQFRVFKEMNNLSKEIINNKQSTILI
jgi:ferredoxin